MGVQSLLPMQQSALQLARMVDANMNRASEGLRVMEDVARFCLDSAELSARCKPVRHGLQEIAALLAASPATLDLQARMTARDTTGDVGTAISTPQEGARESVASMVMAAGNRVCEAFRVIEECAKVLAVPSAAAMAEASRYAAYELQRDIVQAIGRGHTPQWTLCVLVSDHLCSHPWETVVQMAVEGGADCIQLREKGLDDRVLLDRARRVVSICRPHGCAVVINDRVDIALLAGADGVHLGQTDVDIRSARKLAGSSLCIGVSTSNLAEARAAVESGADVCGVGPMFETRTKHKPILAGPEYLSAYLSDPACSRVPHLAIGGIGPKNIGILGKLGCRGVAVSSVVCSAEDPAEVCRSLRRELVGGQVTANPQAPGGLGEPNGRESACPSASKRPGSPTD